MIPRVNVTNELQMDLDTRRAQQLLQRRHRQGAVGVVARLLYSLLGVTGFPEEHGNVYTTAGSESHLPLHANS